MMASRDSGTDYADGYTIDSGEGTISSSPAFAMAQPVLMGLRGANASGPTRLLGGGSAMRLHIIIRTGMEHTTIPH